MCIAILNSKTAPILPFENFEESFYNNPDGFGMIYVKKGTLQTFKDMSEDVDRLYSIYADAKAKNEGSNFALHFRIATSGKVNAANCHPFSVSDKLAFIHNGVIGNGCKRFSDTYHFNRNVLQKLPTNFLSNNGILTLVDSAIGHSKLVFINSENRFHISNEHLGHWDNVGNWFSNYSYLPYVPTTNYWKQKKTKIDTIQDEIFGYGHEVEQWNF